MTANEIFVSRKLERYHHDVEGLMDIVTEKDREITRLKTRLATIRRALELRDAIWDKKCDVDEITYPEGALLIEIETVIAREAGEQ